MTANRLIDQQPKNPPAFPHNVLDHGHGVTSSLNPGMTLRDYFAAICMGAITAQLWSANLNDKSTGERPTWSNMAEQAYGAADAMLEVRQQ